MITVVTGGAGFIGRSLVKRLLALAGKMDEIVLLDNLGRHGVSAGLTRLLSDPRVRLVEADLSEPDGFESVPGPVDRVYHLAARMGVAPVTNAPADALRTNTLSTLRVVEWFAESGSPEARLLFASSSEVYGSAHEAGIKIPVPTAEAVPGVIADLENPRFSYALSKMWGEVYARFADVGAGRRVVSVRYHNVYGPEMGYDHVIPQVVERIRTRQDPFEIIGEEETRAFCWVDDAAEATRLVLEAGNLEPGAVVHVGRNRETSIGSLYELMFDYTAWRPQRTLSRLSPPGSVARRCPDVSALTRLTGYEADTPLTEGLRHTIDWYLKNPPATPINGDRRFI